MTKKSNSATKSAPKKRASSCKKKGGPTNKQLILDAIASQYAAGKDKADKKVVQGLAGMDKKVFDTVCGTMKKKDQWVVYDKDTIELTEEGREQVDPEKMKKAATNDELHERNKEQLKHKKSREIYDIMKDGRYYSKEGLAEAIGLENNKSFGTYLSGLSKLSEKKDGKYRLKDDCFLCGPRPCDV